MHANLSCLLTYPPYPACSSPRRQGSKQDPVGICLLSSANRLPGEAIQTLERGRTLLWSEMRGLRTSIDKLSRAHPTLATKFTNINQDMETLTMSIPPGSTGDMTKTVSWERQGRTRLAIF